MTAMAADVEILEALDAFENRFTWCEAFAQFLHQQMFQFMTNGWGECRSQ